MSMRGRLTTRISAMAGLVVLATSVATLEGGERALAQFDPVADECADPNGDGKVTVSDGVQALRAAAGLSSACTIFSCDLDGNGAVTVTDGVNVLRRAADIAVPGAYRCPVPSTLHDFSEFGRFELSRQPALGFCPRLGSVFHVVLTERMTGAYELHLSVAEMRPEGDPDCIDNPLPFEVEGQCLAAVSQPDRVLTADELTRVRTAFAAVRVSEARDPECAVIAFDPCRITMLRWDNVSVSDFRCADRWLSFATESDLTAVLDTLINDPGPSPTQ